MCLFQDYCQEHYDHLSILKLDQLTFSFVRSQITKFSWRNCRSSQSAASLMQCSFKNLPLLIFIITKLQLQGSGSIRTQLTEELIASSKIEIVFCHCHANFKVTDFPILIYNPSCLVVRSIRWFGYMLQAIPRNSTWKFFKMLKHKIWPGLGLPWRTKGKGLSLKVRVQFVNDLEFFPQMWSFVVHKFLRFHPKSNIIATSEIELRTIRLIADGIKSRDKYVIHIHNNQDHLASTNHKPHQQPETSQISNCSSLNLA